MISSGYKFLTSFLGAGVLLFAITAAFSQAQPERTLFVASCATEKECGEMSIHRFVFRGGNLVSQEVVRRFVTDKRHFQTGNSYILKKRFLVSDWGGVFDLESKQMHDDQFGVLVAIDGNDVFIDEIREGKGPGSTYSFNLETKQYSRHPRPNFYSIFRGPKGPASPDGKKTIDFDALTGALVVVTKTGKSLDKFSSFNVATGYKATCKGCPSTFKVSVPSVWIDEERFVTQRKNGDLVLFDCTTKGWSDVVRIPDTENVSERPLLFSDAVGGIYYDAGKLYKIDVAGKRYTVTEEVQLGHGFTVSGKHDVKLFSYEDRKLAALISRSYNAIDDYLAAEFQEKPLSESRPIGIRVWGKDVGSWTTLKIKYSPRIIGWLTE